MRDTRLLQGLLLSRSDVDRAAHRRADADWLALALQADTTCVMWVSGGDAAVTAAGPGMRLVLSPVPADADDLTFLGVDPDGTAYFCAHVGVDAREAMAPGASWVTLRDGGEYLDDREAGLMVSAVALDNWRAATRRCGECGGELAMVQSGWAMRCEADERELFPRSDPAVIVLPRTRDDRALLGRHVNWPEGRMSTFAGFVEAGESAEAALRRELEEETGVVVGSAEDDVVYLGSQPWPFPWSLMLGYHAWTDSTDLSLGEDEIAEARWFTRQELRDAMDAGEVRLPPPISISRRLIERWLAE